MGNKKKESKGIGRFFLLLIFIILLNGCDVFNQKADITKINLEGMSKEEINQLNIKYKEQLDNLEEELLNQTDMVDRFKIQVILQKTKYHYIFYDENFSCDNLNVYKDYPYFVQEYISLECESQIKTKENLKILDDFISEYKNVDDNTKIKLLIKKIQDIPYDTAKYKSLIAGSHEGQVTSVEVIKTTKGICSEKSSLLFYYLTRFGYKAVIIDFDSIEHQAVGIKCNQINNQFIESYCLIETTTSYYGIIVNHFYFDEYPNPKITSSNKGIKSLKL